MSDKNSTINRFQYSSPSNTSISTFKKDNDTAQVRELLDIQKAIKSLDVSLVKNILRKSNFLPNTLKKKLSFALSIYSSNNPVNRLKSNTSNSSMDLNKTPSDKPKQNSSFSPLKKMDQTQSSENLLSVGPVDEKTPIREIILELLQTNADPDALTDHPLVKKDKISCLLLACIRLDLPFICELLKYKPNVNLKDQHGRNSLILLLNSVPIQAEKIESTSKVQKYDEELLLDTIRRLISAGISINDFDNQGNSPLTIAISKNLEKIVSLLLEFRANVNHKVKSNFNSTPMHIAVHIENINMVKLLLEHKPDLLLENSYGYNAIDEAVKIKASTDIYKILAEEQSLRITQMEKFKEEDKEIIEEPKPVETPDDIQVKDDIIETKREFTLLNKIQNSQVVHSELSYINSNNNTEKQQPNEETPADVKIPDGPSSQISYVLTSNSLEFNSKANAQNPAMNQNSNTIVLPNNNNENNFFYLIPKSPSTTNIQNSSTYPISQNDLNVTFNLTDRDRKYGRIKSIIESNNISANKLVMKKVEKISNLEVPINTINSNHAFNYSHIVPLGNTLTNNVQSSQNTSFTNNITSNLNTSINSMVNPLNHIYNDEIFEGKLSKYH